MNELSHAMWADPNVISRTTRSTSETAKPATPAKQIVTIRLDTDTLAWFKSQGPGYQTRINQLLREFMLEQQAK
jgi:uncharacterized protein (DUF4415 family)